MATIDAVLTRLDGMNERIGRMHRDAEQAQAQLMEWSRGVKWMTFEADSSPNGGANLNQYTLPYWPESGYVWDLKLISVQLSASSAFDIYLGDQPAAIGTAGILPRRQIYHNGQAATQFVATWSSHQVMVFADQKITLDAETSNALINEFFVTAVQVPAEMMAKVLT